MSVSDRPILIKKVKKVSGGGHHGGAWKVAYADFVTAMMAFFLLMWLINTTDPEQKRGIAEYFAPASVSETTSGSGGILGGTALGDDGPKSSGSQSVLQELAPEAPATDQTGPSANLSSASDAALQAEMQKREAAEFASAAEFPGVRPCSRCRNCRTFQTADRGPDARGPAHPAGRSGRPVDVRQQLGPPQRPRPGPAARGVQGHQSAAQPYLHHRHTSATAGSNRASAPADWSLSSDRANASRLVLQSAGVDADRIYSVAGKAGSDPLYPDDPSLAGNRRIAIVLLREAPVLPTDTSL